MNLQYRILSRILHFKEPAGTSRGIYRTRQVWYVVLRSEDRFGLGECAPLPDLSEDALPPEEYIRCLDSFLTHWVATGVLDTIALQRYPSMLFGIETALRTLKHGLLDPFPNTAFTRGETSVPVNGLVWMGTYEEMAARMEEKLQQDFHCIKIKIGAIDFEKEISLIASLRERFSASQVQIRIDANGAFSPDEAMNKLERLASFNLHSIEQPIRAGQWEAMADICRATPIPVALDEELIGIHGTERIKLLDKIHPQYIVLKPSLHGGISGSEFWMNEARKRGIGYWITSALESNVGLNAVAGLAGSHPEITIPQGLGTGSLFVKNFSYTSLSLESGHMWARSAAQLQYERKLKNLRREWNGTGATMLLHTSGSTGAPRPILVEKKRMLASAQRTCIFFDLQKGDTALLCLPLEYVGGMMQAIRAFETSLHIVPVYPNSRPLKDLRTSPRFAAMTPHQVYESLRHPRQRRILAGIGDIIVGGGAVSTELETELAEMPCRVWSTYGMTETLSHIALRRINGPNPEKVYRPLDGVMVRLNTEGCLCIYDPAVNESEIVTNDLAEICSEGFRITGRRDNVVCSGGLKFQIEKLETCIGHLDVPYALTSVPDAKFGEALTLVFEGKPEQTSKIEKIVNEKLHGAERPKHFLCSSTPLPITQTGKLARHTLKEMAEILQKNN